MYQVMSTDSTSIIMVMVTEMVVVVAMAVMAQVAVDIDMVKVACHVVIEAGNKVITVKQRQLYMLITMFTEVEVMGLAIGRLNLVLTVPLSSPYSLLIPILSSHGLFMVQT